MMPTQPPATSARTSIHDNVLISDVARSRSVSKMTLSAATTTRRVHQGGGVCSRCGLYKNGGLYKDYKEACSVDPPTAAAVAAAAPVPYQFARPLVCRQCITATREHNTTPPKRNDLVFQRKVYGALLPATLECSMCHVWKNTATEFTRKEKKRYYCAEQHIICFTCHRIQCKNRLSQQLLIKKETKRIRKERNRSLKRNETNATMSPCAAPHQDHTRLAATIESISKNNNYYYHQDRTTYYHQQPPAAPLYYHYNPHYNNNNNAPPPFTKTPTYYSNNNNTFATTTTTTTMQNHDGGSASGGGWDAATAALRQHNATV